MTGLHGPDAWRGPSSDPNDEQFGDVAEATTLEDAGAYDAVLVGEPYDGAVISRKGAAEAPAALRESLAATKTHHVDGGPVESVGDLGDVVVPDDPNASVSDVQREVRETTANVHDADAVPIFLGGDNSMTVPNVAPLLDRHASVGVVSFDAHLDCREIREEPTSGTPYRQLFEMGLETLAVVGARHFETSTAYHEFLREQGGVVVPADAVGESPEAAVEQALDAMDGMDAVYVSLDVDVLDASAAPGVSAPTPGGLTTRELFGMLARVAGHDAVVGFEVVECAPPLDSGTLTVDAAARAVAHVLHGFAGHETGGERRV